MKGASVALLVLPQAPSTAPLVDLLRLLSHQRYIRPFAYTITVASELTVVAAGIESKLSLVEFIRSDTDSFSVIRLAMADSPPGAGEEVALDIEREIASSLSFKDGEERQVLHLLNLVAPAAFPNSIDSNWFLEGPRGAWRNCLLAPELHPRSDLAVAPVRPNEEYIAHVACSIITLGGLWWGAESGDLQLSVSRERDTWHLVRTRARIIEAVDLPDVVIGRVTRGQPPPPSDPVRLFIPIDEDDVDQILEAAVEIWASENHLIAEAPPLPRPPDQDRISIRELFGLIGSFLTFGLARRLAQEARASSEALKEWGHRRLNATIGSDELSFAVGSAGRSQSSSTPFQDGAGLPVVSPVRPAEPAVWQQLRAIAFGLLDGGELPAHLQTSLSEGSTRRVVASRLDIVESSEAPFENGDDSPPAPTTVATPRESFMARVLSHLEQQLSAAGVMVNDLELRLNELEMARQVLQDLAGQPWWRRFARRCFRAVKVVAIVGTAALMIAVLPELLALAGIALVIWLVVVGAAVVVGALALLARLVWRWFREAHLRAGTLPESQLLEEALRVARLQRSRFEFLSEVATDWYRMVRVLVHEPFGTPLLNPRPRMRNLELHLSGSNLVEEALVSELRRDGLVAAVRRKEFQSGWLSRLYSTAEGLALREFELRQPGLPFNPDHDRSRPGDPAVGPRKILRDSILMGRARAMGRQRVALDVYSMLLTGNGLVEPTQDLLDVMFSEMEPSGRPSDFMSDVAKGTPASWNSGSLQVKAGDESAARNVERIAERLRMHQPLPELPDVEAFFDGETVTFEPFVFSSWVIEGSKDVPASQLTFFSDSPTPVTLDLDRANTIWTIPGDDDEGEVTSLDPSVRAEWGILEQDLPELGDLIVPLAPPTAPAGTGPYCFLVEVDGEPACLAEGIMGYRLRCESAPSNGVEIARHSLQQAADATGLSFRFDGAYDGLPPARRATADLIIAWAFDDEYRAYERECGHEPGSSIGLGGPTTGSDTEGRQVLIGGSAVLNAEMSYTTDIVEHPSHAVVLLHEIGHALNLGHVSSPREIMCTGPSRSSIDNWGPGDRSGLLMIAGR